MEDNNNWHYRIPNEDELKHALNELKLKKYLESMYKVVEKKYLPNEQGYTLDHKISEYELLQFRDSINKQWLEKIKEINPKLSNRILEENISIQDYHQISDYLAHEEIWSKSSRILPLEFVNWFIHSEFAKSLKKYGEFEISDEDNLGWPNIYWRLVRPSKKSDIGPLHRDSWFWKLNENFPKPKYSFFRLKVWIPIYIELGLNGLLVEPFSQLREDIEWDGEIRHGIKKTNINNS